MARIQTITTTALVFALMGGCVDGAVDTGGEDEVGADDSLGEDTSALTSPVYPTAHPRIYLTPNRTRLKTALDNNTAAASAFRTKVDQWVAGSDIWGFQAWNAALMGQLTGNSKYCSKAIATVEAQVATAEQKIAGGAAPEVANDSYLGIGEMIGDLALVYDWCYASVSSSQRTRWINYANQAIYNVWNPSSATWGGRSFPWSGWSINNPSNNYYYSFLRATMLMGLATKGESAKADTWISTFRNAKIGNQLVPTFNTDLVGGASREGTGYGVAMRRLFELYDLWYATTGEQISKLTSHTRNSMLAFMHQVVPTLDKVAPTGDQSRDSTAAFFDYHRNYLQELIGLMPTDTVSGRAKTMLAQSSIKQMSSGFMVAYDFLYDRPDVTTRSLSGLNTAYYAKGIGEVYARSDWGKTATWVNLIAGPYTESHAHQDQGSLMIYKGGWLAYDSVINSRSGLNQDTGSHSLVRIDSGSTPLRQIANTISKVTALHQGPGWVHISADVTAAYGGNSLVQKVQREIVYIQPNIVVVYDRVATSSGTYQTWQLASPVAPSISGNAATFSNAGHTLKVTRMQPSSATTSTYAFSSSSDFTGGYRLNEKVSGADNRFLHVMSIDGAASSITSTGTTSQPGVTINLASGGTATVKFNRDSVGGVLTLAGVTTTLTAAVDALPN